LDAACSRGASAYEIIRSIHEKGRGEGIKREIVPDGFSLKKNAQRSFNPVAYYKCAAHVKSQEVLNIFFL